MSRQSGQRRGKPARHARIRSLLCAKRRSPALSPGWSSCRCRLARLLAYSPVHRAPAERLQYRANLRRTDPEPGEPRRAAAGDFAAAVRLGLPETLHRQVQVLQTSGNTALVRDARTRAASGQQIGAVTSQYAVDRRSLEATASHPSSWSVTNAKGLTISWPIGAEQQNYTGWVDFTQTTTQLKYVRQEQHGGVNTYVYEATVPPTPIKNPQVLQGLPTVTAGERAAGEPARPGWSRRACSRASRGHSRMRPRSRSVTRIRPQAPTGSRRPPGSSSTSTPASSRREGPPSRAGRSSRCFRCSSTATRAVRPAFRRRPPMRRTAVTPSRRSARQCRSWWRPSDSCSSSSPSFSACAGRKA